MWKLAFLRLGSGGGGFWASRCIQRVGESRLKMLDGKSGGVGSTVFMMDARLLQRTAVLDGIVDGGVRAKRLLSVLFEQKKSKFGCDEDGSDQVTFAGRGSKHQPTRDKPHPVGRCHKGIADATQSLCWHAER